MTNSKNTSKSILNAIANHLDAHTRIGTYHFARRIGLTVSRSDNKAEHIAAALAELKTDPEYCAKLMVLVSKDSPFVVHPDFNTMRVYR